MKERGILFSAPMVRAILAGRKSVTRRIVKPQPLRFNGIQPMWGTSPPPNPVEFGEKWLWRESGPDYPDDSSDDRRCPYGVPGDRLWVRETFALSVRDPEQADLDLKEPAHWDGAVYRADGEEQGGGWTRRDEDGTERRITPPWKPGIHMPRWACRLVLDVTDVRVERLDQITEEDAKAEGVEPFEYDQEGDCWTARPDVHRSAFEYLWGEINGWDGQPGARAPWATNPWVWVVRFRRVEP